MSFDPPAGDRAANVLFLTSESISSLLAGVGVRYVELARAAVSRFQVTLASPQEGSSPVSGMVLVTHPFGSAARGKLLSSADVVVAQAFASREIAPVGMADQRPALVIDLYCPFWFENAVASLACADETPFQRRFDIATVRDQLRTGDYFLCATDRQRDMLIGMLVVMGRVTPLQLRGDPALRRLIGIVPFGLTSTPFPMDGPVVHELLPTLTYRDRIIVWGGGIHDWLDVETPIQAMALLQERSPNIKLLFATTVSHPAHEARPTAALAQRLAEETGLLGTSILFLEGWTPYDERDRYLRGATAGLVCHLDHIETRFAFRTRVLDYLWAGLPIVTSDGDEFADLVRQHGLGVVVPPGDPLALADAFVDLIKRIDAGEPFGDRIAAIRPRFHWERVAQPLLEFCANPRKTAHLGDQVLMSSILDVITPQRELARLAYRTVAVLRGEGLEAVARKAMRTIRRIVGRF